MTFPLVDWADADDRGEAVGKKWTWMPPRLDRVQPSGNKSTRVAGDARDEASGAYKCAHPQHRS
jgi:hypothetical protein